MLLVFFRFIKGIKFCKDLVKIFVSVIVNSMEKLHCFFCILIKMVSLRLFSERPFSVIFVLAWSGIHQFLYTILNWNVTFASYKCYKFFSISFYSNFSVFLCKREEEFSPLKNGPDTPKCSPISCRQDVSSLNRQYLQNAGAKFVDDDGNVVENW